jgi:hypothetical protein
VGGVGVAVAAVKVEKAGAGLQGNLAESLGEAAGPRVGKVKVVLAVRESGA